MRKGLLGLATVLAMYTAAPAPADACSIDLVGTGAPSPRRAVGRSSRPSSVLVVGSSPRLMRELTAKGHQVDVVADLGGAARDKTYAVIVTDEQNESAARAKYGAAHVVVRTTDIGNVVQSVEETLARRVLAHRGGPALKTQLPGTPKDAGGGTTPPNPPAVASSVKPQDETAGPQVAKAIPKSAPLLKEQIFFGLGSASVSRKAVIAHVVKWLGSNANATLVIEGYSDPTGTPEANMILSQHRAEAVRDALLAEGVDLSRIEVQAYGDTKLDYARTDGRNRHVSIRAKR